MKKLPVFEIQFKQRKQLCVITVYNSYPIKDSLKENGFKYSSFDKVWKKEIMIDSINDILEAAKQYFKSFNCKVCILIEADLDTVLKIRQKYSHLDNTYTSGDFVYTEFYNINNIDFEEMHDILKSEIKLGKYYLNALEDLKNKKITKNVEKYFLIESEVTHKKN